MDNHEKYLSYPTQSTSSTDHHNTTSANHEGVVTVSSNGAVYATVAVSITVPINPPTDVQPVMYSNITGDNTKVLL